MFVATRKMIRPFLPIDGLRIALQHVLCDKTHGFFVATDGKQMVYWKSEYADAIKSSCLLPVEAFPTQKKHNVSIKASHKSIVVFDDDRSVKRIYPVPKCGKYPDWHALISNLRVPVPGPIRCIDPSLLGAFALWDDLVYLKQYASTNSEDSVLPPIVVFPNNPDKALRYWQGVVMPARPEGGDSDYEIENFGNEEDDR